MVTSTCTYTGAYTAAYTGCVPHCAGCFGFHFLVLSSVPCGCSVTQDLGYEAGSRIISILQMRKLRFREVHTVTRSTIHSREFSSFQPHLLSSIPCNLMRDFGRDSKHSDSLLTLLSQSPQDPAAGSHIRTSGPPLCAESVALLSSAWPVVI